MNLDHLLPTDDNYLMDIPSMHRDCDFSCPAVTYAGYQPWHETGIKHPDGPTWKDFVAKAESSAGKVAEISAYNAIGAAILVLDVLALVVVCWLQFN